MVYINSVITRFLRGCRRTGIFAITSKCNCRCQMCDIRKNKPMNMRYSDITRTLNFMAENKFLIAYFTGGEPSLHPNLVEAVRYADRLGLVTSLTTNGTISPDMLEDLKEAGLYALSISIDSWDPAIGEEVRRHRGILQKQKRSFEIAQKLGIRTYGMTFLGTHLTPENIEKMVVYVNSSLNAPFGFCYPLTTDRTTYRLGQSVQMHPAETVKKIVERILMLKKKGYQVANTATYMEEVLRFHDNQTSKFPCKGGEYVFYIDWLGNVYPCFMKSKLFNLLEDNEHCFLKGVRCFDCLGDCFREPSLLAYISSLPLIAKEIAYNFPIKSTIL